MLGGDHVKNASKMSRTLAFFSQRALCVKNKIIINTSIKVQRRTTAPVCVCVCVW